MTKAFCWGRRVVVLGFGLFALADVAAANDVYQGRLQVTAICGRTEPHVHEVGSDLIHELVAADGSSQVLKARGKSAERLADLRPGSKIRVRGKKSAGQIQLADDGAAVEVLQLAPAAAAITGARRVLVLLVNFQDKQLQPITVTQARDMFFGQVNSFYQESSYGQASLAGDVAGWFTLPMNASCDNLGTVATLGKDAAAAAGYDIASYEKFQFFFPGLGCGWTGMGEVNGRHSWINGSLSLRTMGHELGHTFGLLHAHAYSNCADAAPYDASRCTMQEYGHIADIMGASGVVGHQHSYFKEQLGWLPEGSVQTISSSGNYFIAPYGTPLDGRAKALRIFHSIDPTSNAPRYLHVDYRQLYGFDKRAGVMVNFNVYSGTGKTYFLDLSPETTSTFDGMLAVGRSFLDVATGMSITTVSADSSGAWINVSVASPVPSPTPSPAPTNDTIKPTVAVVSPASGSTVSGIVNVEVQASDNVGVQSLRVLVNGSLQAVLSPSNPNYALDTRNYPNGQIGIAASASDAAGNVGISSSVFVTVNNVVVSPSPSPSPTVTVTPSPSPTVTPSPSPSPTPTVTVTPSPSPSPVVDSTPPSAPQSLAVAAANLRKQLRFRLSWQASTDNVAVAGYQVVRNGTVIATVAAGTLSYIDSSIAPATGYVYQVRAYDTSNNLSAGSNQVSVVSGSSSGKPARTGR